MNRKLLQLAGLIGWLATIHLSTTQPVFAQAPATRGQLDHPSHRYLPPPIGRGNIADQVRALEEMRAEEPSPAPFELSSSQLKQLDSIVESFRNDQGELELPDPQSIPKQWIDSLMPDPKQRQQVKDVLEEYARTRNLQLDKDDGSSALPPFESPASGPTSPRPDDARGSRSGDGSRSGNGPRRENQSPPSSTDGPTTTGEATTAGPSTAGPSTGERAQDRLTELRNLYETLKKIQEQRAQQEQQLQPGSASSRWQRPNGPSDRNRSTAGASNNDARSSDARSSDARSSDARNPRTSRPNESLRPAPRTPGNTLRDRADRMPGTNSTRSNNLNNTQPNNAQPGRLRPPPQLTDNDAANGVGTNPNGGNGNGGNSNDANGTPGQRPSNDASENTGARSNKDPSQGSGTSADPKAPTLTPFDEGYDYAKDQKVAVDPFAAPEDAVSDPSSKGGNGLKRSTPPARPAEPFRVTQLAQQPQPQPQRPRGESNEPGFDLKKSIDESGLGTALKRIVQKTLKEQGYDPSQPGNSQTASPNANAGNSNFPTPANQLPGGKLPSTATTEQLKNWANSVATAPGGTSNSSSTPANSQWGQWVNEVWKSVATASARASSSSSSSPYSAPSAAAAPSALDQLPEVRWTNSMTVAVIAVAGLILVFVWLSRRRVAELADASAAQAEWVRTVMAQGLKTRADVVRAFHQLVKQSRSVSDWWTHRSIVTHFNSHTPQVAPAISALAIVYEQARYYPDDVELSQQQLAEVRTLLESVKIPTSSRA